MKCFDCPDLGPFEGRPTPRAECCATARRREEVTAARAREVDAAERAALPSRQARRAFDRAARNARAKGTPQ